MTFDETIEKFEQEANEYNGLVPMETVYELILDLKEEYAPTVEMTKEDKQSLLDLKSRATFYFFNQSVKKWQQDRIGLQMPYGGLTEDELMQAWLHPETIKVINEEQV